MNASQRKYNQIRYTLSYHDLLSMIALHAELSCPVKYDMLHSELSLTVMYAKADAVNNFATFTIFTMRTKHLFGVTIAVNQRS